MWNVLAGGHIRSTAEDERRRKSGEQGRDYGAGWERNEQEKKVCDVLEEIAAELGVGPEAVPASTKFFHISCCYAVLIIVVSRDILHPP